MRCHGSSLDPTFWRYDGIAAALVSAHSRHFRRQPLHFEATGGTLETRHNWPPITILGNVHVRHADRLRYPSRRGRNAHHAVALSRRSLERTGGEPPDRGPRSHEVSPQHAPSLPVRPPPAQSHTRQRPPPRLSASSPPHPLT